MGREERESRLWGVSRGAEGKKGGGGEKVFLAGGRKEGCGEWEWEKGKRGGRHKLFSLMGWEGQNLLSASQTSVYSTRKV